MYKPSIPILTLCLLLVVSTPARTAEPPDATASFDIDRFEVDGDTVIKPSVIRSILARFTGKSRDTNDIEHAIQALEAACHRRGYVLAKVVALDPALRQGAVHLQVIEPRFGKVRISGNAFHNEANIRRSLPHFTEGAIPNTTDLAVDIRVAN